MQSAYLWDNQAFIEDARLLMCFPYADDAIFFAAAYDFAVRWANRTGAASLIVTKSKEVYLAFRGDPQCICLSAVSTAVELNYAVYYRWISNRASISIWPVEVYNASVERYRQEAAAGRTPESSALQH